MLLIPDGKSPEHYADWAKKIGAPSDLGVELNILVSYSKDAKPDWQIRGIVGVPRLPEDDYERVLLAHKLEDQVKAPEFAVFSSFGVESWSERTGGPFTVDVIQSRALRTVTEADVSNTLEVSGPGPLSDPVFRKHFDKAEDWTREYSANRYLRFETRRELNQRYQALMTNITILTDAGAVDLTNAEHWHSLFRHVVAEMFMLGQPPVHHNFDPSVRKAILFPDEGLCTRAANAVSRYPMRGNLVVKYGRAEYMRPLYELGHVYMQPASYFDRPHEHNQAVYDQETISHYKGAMVRQSERGTYLRAQSVYAEPDTFLDPDHDFIHIFEAPDVTRDEFIHFGLEIDSGFWLYCMSDTMMPRMFSDFTADACVVLDRREFIARLRSAWQRLVPAKGELGFGPVIYDDPVGAYANLAVRQGVTNYFTKTFRYTYQREFRFAGMPKPPDETREPLNLYLGSLDDIGELIVLP